MKVAIWANYPSPHQTDFYDALRSSGVDLQVVFLGSMAKSRQAMGWSDTNNSLENECFLPQGMDPFRLVSDWQERLHVIPGYGRRFNLSLLKRLSHASVDWVHWSENSQPSWRSYLSWGLKKWYAQQVNRFALGAFAIGECAAADFQNWGIGIEKIAHLYYSVKGVVDSQVEDQVTKNFVNSRQTFVYVGSFNKNKATLSLLRSFVKVAEVSNSCLVLVGNGPLEKQCRDYVEESNLQNHVLFRGVVPRESIGSILKCCDTLVLPSRYDGWGVVLNEAASAGLALIASTQVGAARHLIVPGWNGFLVKAGSIDSLAYAMKAYANAPELATLHGKNSLHQFQDFTPAMNAERFTSAITGWKSAVLQEGSQPSERAIKASVKVAA